MISFQTLAVSRVDIKQKGKNSQFSEKNCLSVRDFCRGLWDKKSLLWEIAHWFRKWLVQIICNIKCHGTKEKPISCIFSTQKPPKWRPRTIFSVSNYVYSVTNFRVWKSWLCWELANSVHPRGQIFDNPGTTPHPPGFKHSLLKSKHS